MLRTNLLPIVPEITGGTPVFAGTRGPIRRLFRCLRHGHPLAELLLDYPTVAEKQAERVLAAALATLLPDYPRVEPAQIDFSHTEQRREAAA